MLTPGEGVLNTGAMAMPGMRPAVDAANAAGMQGAQPPGGGLPPPPFGGGGGGYGIQPRIFQQGTSYVDRPSIQINAGEPSPVPPWAEPTPLPGNELRYPWIWDERYPWSWNPYEGEPIMLQGGTSGVGEGVDIPPADESYDPGQQFQDVRDLVNRYGSSGLISSWEQYRQAVANRYGLPTARPPGVSSQAYTGPRTVTYPTVVVRGPGGGGRNPFGYGGVPAGAGAPGWGLSSPLAGAGWGPSTFMGGGFGNYTSANPYARPWLDKIVPSRNLPGGGGV
jgi:hypothetical protein